MNLGGCKDFYIRLLLRFPKQQGEESLDTAFLHQGTGALGNMV